ncbi:MAG: peptidyl-prolyl cis-trans isomerase [Vicingaceae bacterium]|nr:MAG: peptidyl-prolyl cis-trans isomerase [Vicingaceae bacterium]
MKIYKLFFFVVIIFMFTSFNTYTEKRTKVKIETSMGTIVVELYNETPKHRDNFIKLVQKGFYDGTLFHRVIREFMIQGGDPDSKNAKKGAILGNGGPGYTIPAEFKPHLFHKKGALAAARLGDDINPKKESSGSQFYIVQGRKFTVDQLKMYEVRLKTKFSEEQIKAYTTLGGAPHLDGSYTVFGQVVNGLDVVDKIASVPTDQYDRPLEDVKVLSMKILK